MVKIILAVLFVGIAIGFVVCYAACVVARYADDIYPYGRDKKEKGEKEKDGDD